MRLSTVDRADSRDQADCSGQTRASTKPQPARVHRARTAAFPSGYTPAGASSATSARPKPRPTDRRRDRQCCDGRALHEQALAVQPNSSPRCIVACGLGRSKHERMPSGDRTHVPRPAMDGVSPRRKCADEREPDSANREHTRLSLQDPSLPPILPHHPILGHLPA